jgi:arylsulfatase
VTRAIGAWLGLAVGLLTGCGGPEPRPDADVLLVTVDTLRADRIGLLGAARATTPSIDRFFAAGRVYERAYSASSSTSPSIVTLLSGRLPHEHRVRLFYQHVPAEVKLVTDHLPRRHQRAAIVSNMVLTDEALGIGRRFDHYDDFVDERESSRLVFERRAARTTDGALAWLEHEADPARPLFLWVHYIDPHRPYEAPAEWRRSFRHESPVPFDPKRLRVPQKTRETDDALDWVDAYDEEVAYTDAEIGRLLAGFDARRGLDRTLVVFTADHGETLNEHEYWFTHRYQVYEVLVRVPLLLRGPGVEPGRSDLPAHGTDVAPTILRFLGVEPPAEMPAVDLRTGDGLARDRQLVVEATDRRQQWRGLIQGDRKWTVLVRGTQREVVEGLSYVLGEDPQEQRPQALDIANPDARPLLELVAGDPDPAGVPEGPLGGSALRAPKLARDVPPDDLERLRALGYVDEGAE